MLAVVLALQLVAQADPAAPAPAVVPSPVAAAEAALAAGDADGCGKRAQEALATGALDVDGTANAWALRARCFVKAGDVDRGERSYAVALRVKRDLAPVDDAAFRAAAKALPPPQDSLSFRAAAVGADVVELELLADDLLLVRAAMLVKGDEEISRVPLEAGHARHKVGGIPVDGLVAVLLDKHGNQLARTPVEGLVDGQPRVVITPDPSSGGGPTILTTLGATALGAGIVGIVASGIGLAALGPEPGDEATVWIVGVGASTALFLTGAGLVVVDQGLDDPSQPPHAAPPAR